MNIGWQEWAGFPELCTTRIKAKIDTGAKTSAIHAFSVSEFERDGAPWASFILHPVQRRKLPEITCQAPIVDRRMIRSSNGIAQERLVIRTTMRMGDREWPVDLSLTNRDDMGFRLLVGRDALKKSILIHPARTFLQGK